ncbi:hypothetical protein BO85DRAFT_98810 [Aspergillus piperis CBS 112811]|uniref:Uncharacterized protein n=1 Tax=Aspergillus piperis CBS 112811 TaxID=1448313 RepID=A0A8G1R0L3_9EURO|nr:hypothetical protein BO85DRAFT_98810 [Aspergillus piperis CBS 112811]RAH54745.1 hypothetical protein BO85DRAFT_98810 [Aspergillus piperis CBS 112811]
MLDSFNRPNRIGYSYRYIPNNLYLSVVKPPFSGLSKTLMSPVYLPWLFGLETPHCSRLMASYPMTSIVMIIIIVPHSGGVIPNNLQMYRFQCARQSGFDRC